MPEINPRQYATVARECRRNGRLIQAALYYDAAAGGWFATAWNLPAEPAESDNHPDINFVNFAGWLRDQFASALCFRLADAHQRCRARCRRGILILEDLRDGDELTEYGTTAHRGLFNEVIGDLRVVGDMDASDTAYAAAGEQYATITDDFGWQADHEFCLAIQPFLELADSVGYDIDEPTRKQIKHTSLDERIAYKRQHYSDIIDAVLDAGNWESDAL